MEISTGMKIKPIVLTAFCCLLNYAMAHATTKPLVSAVSARIYSRSLGAYQDILVSVPVGYDSSVDRYPVIYVLDAEYNLPHTILSAQILGQNELIPPCIVVGIVDNHRSRDLALPLTPGWAPPLEFKETGGAEHFLNYIEKELIPYIDNNYRTQPFRLLIGHSLAGLFALHTMCTRSYLFHGFVVIDASIFWNNGQVVNEVEQFVIEDQPHPRLFWGRDQIPREVWFEENLKLKTLLDDTRPSTMQFEFLEIPNETHGSVVLPATYFGLKSIFRDYAADSHREWTVDSVRAYYKEISSRYGYNVEIPQGLLANAAFQTIDLGQTNIALEALEENYRKHPKSSVARDNLAEAYHRAGMDQKANSLRKLNLH